MNKLIERLAHIASEAARNASTWDWLELEKAGVRAVLAELAKTDVGDAMPTVDEVAAELRKHKPGAGAAAEVAVEYIGAHVAPIIAALRAQVTELQDELKVTQDLFDAACADVGEKDKRIAELEAHIASAGLGGAIDAALADEPIADHAERAKKVAELLQDRGLFADYWKGHTITLPRWMRHASGALVLGYLPICLDLHMFDGLTPLQCAELIHADERRCVKKWAAR